MSDRESRFESRRRVPFPGDTWRSRDKRDEGLTVTVLAVDDPHSGGFVYIKRFRKSRVRYARWHSEYEFVSGPYGV